MEKEIFQPSRAACYLRFFGIAALGWVLAIGSMSGWFRMLRDGPGVSGWWWIPFLIIIAVTMILIVFGFALGMAAVAKWEGAITAFIKADVEMLAIKTPFPNACRKFIHGALIALFVPWILALAGGSSD